MNIVILMAGVVGRRFGSMIPKQYNLLCGQPVIDYVIDAIRKSKVTDKVVVVIDQQWIEYSDKGGSGQPLSLYEVRENLCAAVLL